MPEDPRINFAISTRGSKPGIDHLGIQADSEEEVCRIEGCKPVDIAVEPASCC
jgi:hypothetical protein